LGCGGGGLVLWGGGWWFFGFVGLVGVCVWVCCSVFFLVIVSTVWDALFRRCRDVLPHRGAEAISASSGVDRELPRRRRRGRGCSRAAVRTPLAAPRAASPHWRASRPPQPTRGQGVESTRSMTRNGAARASRDPNLFAMFRRTDVSSPRRARGRPVAVDRAVEGSVRVGAVRSALASTVSRAFNHLTAIVGMSRTFIALAVPFTANCTRRSSSRSSARPINIAAMVYFAAMCATHLGHAVL